MVQEIEIGDFLKENGPLIDVRSPGEFAKGHIPGACNIPLFSDEERAEVGTVYVRQSREKAIDLGYRFVKPKLDWFIDKTLRAAPLREVTVHCWRGGMRSQSFASHLSENGFKKVSIVRGGYKSYRFHLLESFSTPCNIRIIGGYTGSGKTLVLSELRKLGEQTVDLEALACHKGSAFGGIGQPDQPTTEQFENNLFEIWRHFDFSRIIWLEDESHNVGGVNLPMNLYLQMKSAGVFFLRLPKTERARQLVLEYGSLDKKMLATAISMISKRLGGDVTKQALTALENGEFDQVAQLALYHYDKMYLKSLNQRKPETLVPIDFKTIDPLHIAQTLITINYNE